jgi:hypothetical protein
MDSGSVWVSKRHLYVRGADWSVQRCILATAMELKCGAFPSTLPLGFLTALFEGTGCWGVCASS